MIDDEVKQQVKAYWNAASCGTEYIDEKKFTPAYFHAIEQHRYHIEPEIHAFAQFTRWHGKKVLEVGIGAGTDFVQWVRAGALAYGIDLTPEAVNHATMRLAQQKLHAQEIRVADAEQLPYENDSFDLVYSWGVIHHSPDMPQCLAQMIRVCKPGGTIKLMLYNKHSLFAWYRYIMCALFKGNPFKSLDTILAHEQESPGTKAYTRAHIRRMLKEYPVKIISLSAPVSAHDLLYYKARPFRALAYLAATLCGWRRVGWFMHVELKKEGA